MSVRAPLKPSAFEASETFELGRFKRARRAYGFDEVALVPGRVTINPEEVDSSVELGSLRLAVPILAAAMDGVVDVAFAVEMGRLGGMAVLNLDGLQTRYADPTSVLQEVADAPREHVNALLQRVYQAPVREQLSGSRR
jgi:IMP dehydrogenase